MKSVNREAGEFLAPQIYVSGSRGVVNPALEFTDRLVQRIHQLNGIIATSTSYGVEQHVMRACRRIGARHRCYTLDQCSRDSALVVAPDPDLSLALNLLRKDEIIIRESQFCVFIWNGRSPGTESRIAFAQNVGRPGLCFVFPSTNEETWRFKWGW